MLSDAVKLFLEDVAVKQAIQNMDIEEVYRLAGSNLSWQLTSYFVNDIGFNPLEHLTVVPPYYMQQEMSLGTLTIPGNVETVKHNAFNHCYNLGVVNIEEGVKYIDKQAFYMATIRLLRLPKSLLEFPTGSISQEDGKIVYAGTKADFRSKFSGKLQNLKRVEIVCSDGQLK